MTFIEFSRAGKMPLRETSQNVRCMSNSLSTAIEHSRGDYCDPLARRGVSAAKRAFDLIEGIRFNDEFVERELVAALRQKRDGCLKVAGMVVVDASKRDHAPHDGLRIDRNWLAVSHCTRQHYRAARSR